MARIGVFDSGVGGLSVARAIEKALPNHQVMYREDKANIPYGTKTTEELRAIVVPILTELAAVCDTIVIACNTVSTTLGTELQAALPVPVILTEPMIVAAAEKTISKMIAVCATPTTLASPRYKQLLETDAKHLTVLEPDCSTWSYMIEHDAIDEQMIRDSIETVCEKGADVIVLACTHYHWIEDRINEVAGSRAIVLQPEPMIISELERVLARLG